MIVIAILDEELQTQISASGSIKINLHADEYANYQSLLSRIE